MSSLQKELAVAPAVASSWQRCILATDTFSYTPI